MKFFLAKDEPFIFSEDHSVENGKGKAGSFTMKYEVIKGDLDELDGQVSAVLKGMVDHYACPIKDIPDMKVTLLAKKTLTNRQGMLVLGYHQQNFLKDISILFGQDNVRVKVMLAFLSTPNFRGDINCLISTKAMHVICRHSMLSCRDDFIQIPNSGILDQLLVSRKYISALITVEVTVDTKFIRPRASTKDLCEKMLHDEIHSDITITAENGSQIKCHKSVLSACSPVFGAMFTTDMEESKSHNVDMPDMSELAVKSFLNYIYCMNEDEPRKNCEIAFELLNAAHKYNVIPDLETAMINLILSKPAEWFNVDIGVRIFLFARNIPNKSALRDKAIQILKTYCTALPESETYVKMFKENHTAAMELCQLSFGSP